MAVCFLASMSGPLLRAQTLRKKMQRQVTVTWQGQELGAALDRLTEASEVTLWLDRRVDRQLRIDAQVTDQPLLAAIETVVSPYSLAVTQLGDLVYVGPQQTAAELPALAERARKMLGKAPKSVRQKWLEAKPVTWQRLSQPRALATDWLREANIELIGGERIAHDLWPSQSLPATPLVDRLALLLAGFDLTCEIAADGRSCEVVPIPRPLKRTRPSTSSSGEPASAGGESRRNPRSHQVFTLHLKNQPLGPVLDQIAKQLDLEIVWPEDATLRKRLVNCDAQNVELDELLRTVLGSVNLRHQREGKQINIRMTPTAP